MFFKKDKKKEQTPEEILASFSILEKKVGELEKQLSELKKEKEEMIQNIGLVRFNPFSGVGGDQSFSLAILDGKNNGAVITSFYAREGCSVYGKKIEKGDSQHTLSDEEKKAIDMATKGNNFLEKPKPKKRNGAKK